jgi:hypothetical protein
MVANPAGGDVWFLDGSGGRAVYRVTPDDAVQTIAFNATGASDMAVSADDKAWIAVNNGGAVVAADSSGKATGYYLPSHLSGAYGIAAGSGTAIWVTGIAGQAFLMNPAQYAADNLPFNTAVGN